MFSFTQPPTQGVKGCEKEVQCIQNGQGLVKMEKVYSESISETEGGKVLKRDRRA